MCHFIVYFIQAVVFITLCTAANVTLTSEQLQNLVSQLWVADGNRATSSQLDLNFQNHVDSYGRVDASPDELFRNVDPTLLSRPTVAALIDLF